LSHQLWLLLLLWRLWLLLLLRLYLLHLQLLVDNVLCLLGNHTSLDQMGCLGRGLQLHLLLLLDLLLLNLLLLNVLLDDVLLLLLLRRSGINDAIVVRMDGCLAHNQLLMLRTLDQHRLLLNNHVCVVEHLRGRKMCDFVRM